MRAGSIFPGCPVQKESLTSTQNDSDNVIRKFNFVFLQSFIRYSFIIIHQVVVYNYSSDIRLDSRMCKLSRIYFKCLCVLQSLRRWLDQNDIEMYKIKIPSRKACQSTTFHCLNMPISNVLVVAIVMVAFKSSLTQCKSGNEILCVLIRAFEYHRPQVVLVGRGRGSTGTGLQVGFPLFHLPRATAILKPDFH